MYMHTARAQAWAPPAIVPRMKKGRPLAPAQRGAPRIREWREKRGMSQGDLGEKVGLSQTQIGRIEAGKKGGGLTMPVLKRMAKALDVPASELIPQDQQDALAGGFNELSIPLAHAMGEEIAARGQLMDDPIARHIVIAALELPGEAPLEIAVEIMRQYRARRQAAPSRPPRRA